MHSGSTHPFVSVDLSGPSNDPALQGGRERRSHQFEFLQEHWSPAARFVAGAAGASLAVYGGTRRDDLGAGLGAAGLLLLTRGITNTEFTRLARLSDGEKTDGEGSKIELKPLRASK